MQPLTQKQSPVLPSPQKAIILIQQSHHTFSNHNSNPLFHNPDPIDAPRRHKNLGAELLIPQSCHNTSIIFSEYHLSAPHFIPPLKCCVYHTPIYNSAPSTHKNLGAKSFTLICLLLVAGYRNRPKILKKLQGVVLAFSILNILQLFQFSWACYDPQNMMPLCYGFISSNIKEIPYVAVWTTGKQNHNCPSSQQLLHPMLQAKHFIICTDFQLIISRDPDLVQPPCQATNFTSIGSQIVQNLGRIRLRSQT